jgi:GntR family transcriptional regulator, transcriptional repressor for pyruvate dehydrogenase complex
VSPAATSATRPVRGLASPGMAASPDEPRPNPFKAVRRVRSFDEVVMQIQGAIISGHYSTGDRLPNERELSTMLDVSRPTLREALRSLEVLGILDIRPGKRGGIFVAAPSGSGVGSALEALILLRRATTAELNEFRMSFEGETAAWAAERADEEDAERLLSHTAAVRAAAARPGTRWEEMVELDVRFHELVANASKNQVRVAVMLGLLRAVERVELRVTPIADPGLHRDVGAELTAVAEAIRDHDPERARTAMRAHLARFFARYFDGTEPTEEPT